MAFSSVTWKYLIQSILILAVASLASLAVANPFQDAYITKVGGDFSHPWGITLLDDSTALVTERDGRLTQLDLITGDRLNITGLPDVYTKRQGGLLDILAHDGMIYFCFSRPVKGGGATALAGAQIVADRLEHVEIIFTSNVISRSGVHFGCRLAVKDSTIFLSHGDRGARDSAQDPISHGGAVIGVDLKTHQARIYTKGHRNPQGMAIHPTTGAIWVNEHGPRGGDEINILKDGDNYGWPIVSHGREYSGRQVGDGIKSLSGYTDPIWVWVPSIAPSGMAFYDGTMFPELKGDILVTSLKFRSLYHVTLEGGVPVSEVSTLKQRLGRLRDVEVMPDGSLLVLSDEAQGGVYRISR